MHFQIQIPSSTQILKTRQAQKAVYADVLADVPIAVLAVEELASGTVVKPGLAAGAVATELHLFGAS